MTIQGNSTPTGGSALYSGIAALLAFVACNGLIVVTAVLSLAGTGSLVIILTLYISYDKLVESVGLLSLIVAAGWNWRAIRQNASRN